MIAGIGTDIIKTSKIAAALDRHGDRFAKRILMSREFSIYQRAANPVAFLAKRFAAKEAVAKALGTGIGKVSFQDIEVSNNSKGAPLLTFHGYAAELQQQNCIANCHITIADEEDNAVAFVVLEYGV